MSNNLNNMRAYLCGPIDFAKDNGVGWRNMITPILKKFNVKVMDPCKKPIETKGLNEESPEYFKQKQRLKDEGRFAELAELMKPVRAVDLAMVDRADFLVCYIDITIHSVGTMEEIFWSNRCKKPTLLVCQQGKKFVSDWFWACLPTQHIFGNFTELTDYLSYVNDTPQEKVETFNRWKFFRFE